MSDPADDDWRSRPPVVAAGGIEIPRAPFTPATSADATRITSLDHLHQILQVIHDPPSLTALRDSFRRMSGYHKDKHALYDEREGFRDVYRAILVRAKELRYTLKADRFFPPENQVRR